MEVYPNLLKNTVKCLLTGLTLTVPVAYASVSEATNLVFNGDFEAGDTGFYSEYISTPSFYEGTYDIGSADPTVFGDHTSGADGNVMGVNGSTVPNTILWQQKVSVVTNSDYKFSAWIGTVFLSSPANLSFSVNGTILGTKSASDTTLFIWEEFSANWNSGTNTSAILSIVDLNTDFFGNDFYLDDISFVGPATAVPEPITILGTFTATAFGALFKRKLDKAKH